MLMPKKVKYRKQQRGRRRGLAWRGSTVAFGDFGLMALEACWMTDRQIEAARVALTRGIKRGGKVWIRVFPDKPVTKKPQETRMGKGKGAPEGWVAVVKPGRILFEMEGVTLAEARAAMRLAAAKLPIPTRFADAIRPGAGVMKVREMLSELRGLTVEDLRARARELDDQVFRLRLQKSMGQSEAGNKIRPLRRESARVQTVLREKGVKE